MSVDSCLVRGALPAKIQPYPGTTDHQQDDQYALWHRESQERPVDFGALAVATQHSFHDLTQRQKLDELIERRPAGRHQISRQMLDVDMPAGHRHSGERHQTDQGTVNARANLSRVVQTRQQKQDAKTDDGEPLKYAKRTRLEMQTVLHIERVSHESSAQREPEQIAETP